MRRLKTDPARGAYKRPGLSPACRGWLVVFALTVLVLVIWSTCGCAASGRTLSPDDIAAVVAGVANVQQQETTAGRDAITQTFDQWGPRFDAMSRFVDTLRKWSAWLIIGIPLVTYILPKILWIIVQRYVRSNDRKPK